MVDSNLDSEKIDFRGQEALAKINPVSANYIESESVVTMSRCEMICTFRISMLERPEMAVQRALFDLPSIFDYFFNHVHILSSLVLAAKEESEGELSNFEVQCQELSILTKDIGIWR